MSAVKNKFSILAVDDDENALFALTERLIQEGYEASGATSGLEAIEKAASLLPDLILLDVSMPPGISGFEVTKRLREHPVLKFTPIILLTANNATEDIVEGLESGADDYILKPYNKDELFARVKAAMRLNRLYKDLESATEKNNQLIATLAERSSYANIIGQSAAMQEVFKLIDRVKDADVPVLITGESGTGKELVAKAIHTNSVRSLRPFVVQNCSAFNDNLLESELFGHVKGAFTGAIRDKKGLFEEAHTGTFFLDELGEMQLPLQAKLLRVLQDGTFSSVGDTKQKKVNVRVVAATNRDLEKMVSEKSFREDLFYRLNVVTIELPALERAGDLPLLIDYFLKENAKKRGSQVKKLSADAFKLMCSYDWPGNIRQLQNEIERLVLLSDDSAEIGIQSLSKPLKKYSNLDKTNSADLNDLSYEVENTSGTLLKDSIEALEKKMIIETLKKLAGNKSEAARELGISRSNLIAKVKSYEIEE